MKSYTDGPEKINFDLCKSIDIRKNIECNLCHNKENREIHVIFNYSKLIEFRDKINDTTRSLCRACINIKLKKNNGKYITIIFH